MMTRRKIMAKTHASALLLALLAGCTGHKSAEGVGDNWPSPRAMPMRRIFPP
jgi:hypothetical protein